MLKYASTTFTVTVQYQWKHYAKLVPETLYGDVIRAL